MTSATTLLLNSPCTECCMISNRCLILCVIIPSPFDGFPIAQTFVSVEVVVRDFLPLCRFSRRDDFLMAQLAN